ncbi:hypothetical protein [Isoptericola dokdonensis]|uniref:Uncharacterized protein n=1 Tax=Isoptericola dokdonensis DS-3 TaxID=1300344 RepID=A0A161I196_9MICO|nr:hypothetical protein [Isoptericola dokdonensis]ANC29929.1 hypothetical protein I598_0341 [Isoptericola dokdonensis DS-3]
MTVTVERPPATGANTPPVVRAVDVLCVPYGETNLGHASAEFTLRIYGHALRGANDRALDVVDEALARRSRYTSGTQAATDNVVELRKRA